LSLIGSLTFDLIEQYLRRFFVFKLSALFRATTSIIAVSLCASTPAQAALINFFSFTNKDGSPAGGTVRGTIIFNTLNPGDDAVGIAASSFVINSLPVGFNDSDNGDNFDVGVDLLSLGTTSVETNLFNIGNGIITFADFGIFDTNPSFAFNGICLAGTGTACTEQALLIGGGSGASTATFNEGIDLAGDSDSSTLTFTDRTGTSVPEHTSILGLITVVAFASVFKHNRK
jgi:hypothetical protein